ncbi:MAG: DUF4422 domain-containing protein [Paenirhodobacter sp.]|uniref:DUF4422 domain-containing protein n=1 Tax=Paenirhodobacter sp. TaxID=1965326 RepID=UPI003D14E609
MITIYVNYFAPAKIFESDVLKPIQVGAAASKTDLGILRDDEGDNISLRNPAYCEMTGIYWAWKNDHDSDVLGFLHYRRYFDFAPNTPRQVDRHGLINHPALDTDLIDNFGLTPEAIERAMQGYDMLLPIPFNVQSAGPASVRAHYQTAPHHHIEDLELAGRIVAELSPEYAPHFEAMMSGHMLYPNNMFLFTRPVFEEYCAWLFPILERLDAEIDVSNYTWQEARAVGYIAERLFTVFVLGQKAMKPDLKIKELNLVFVVNTAPDPAEPELPQTDKPVLTVVASCDAAYVPHLGALIGSVFETTSPEYFVDFIVLDGGIAPGQRRLLQKLLHARPDAALSFIDMRFKHLNLPVHSYFSRATFFRLSLPDLLEKRDRILFLDTDMVVVDDVSPLIELDLDGALVAAAPDMVMRAFAKMGVPSIRESGSLPSADYVANYLGMKTPEGKPAVSEYFQAGTLVMDLKALRETGLLRAAIKDLATKTYWFLDQDILNKYLFGKTKFIPGRWNVLWMDDRHAGELAPEDHQIYAQTFENPAIVHYAGIGKPWRNTLNPLSHYYWEALRTTPWYETILFGFLDQRYHGLVAAAAHAQLPAAQPAATPSMPRRALAKTGSAVWRALPHSVKAKIWPFADRLKRAIG